MTDSKVKPRYTISTNIEVPAGVHEFETGDMEAKDQEDPPINRVIYMDDKVIPGSFYVEAVWVLGSEPRSHPMHNHDDHDEIVGFVGSDMDNPDDLGGEIDFTVDGDKLTITKTCFIHIPAGIKHGELCFREINRPVFQIAMSRMPAYESDPPT